MVEPTREQISYECFNSPALFSTEIQLGSGSRDLLSSSVGTCN